MRKWIALMVSLALLLSVACVATNGAGAATAAGGNPYAYGDVNRDSAINAVDALLVLQAAVGLTTLGSVAARAADVDESGGADAVDALWILRFAVGKTSAFPAGATFTPGGESESSSSGSGGGSKKALVVYFSASGNTRRVAEAVAEAAGADLFAIQPVEAYTSADLDWTDPDSRVCQEHDDESLRNVALVAATVENWAEYDTVFIGYPIWWGIAAWPVSSFVKANDFTGKTVIPFCTSASSGLGDSGELLAEAAGSGDWLEGQRFPSSASNDTVTEWVEGLPLTPPANETPAVYMTTDISSAGMMKVYKALGVTLTGDNIAVKLSTGEPPASNYLDPNLIRDVVEEVNGTIVECNTAYGGSRTETAMHYQVAEDHGFTNLGNGFVIMDEEGSMSLPVAGSNRLSENLVGARFGEFDGFLVLSHFKGHAMAGFGGAIKNISIGIGSKEGKCLIHTAGRSHTSPWGGDQDAFLESMADAGKSVVDALNGNILFINVMNRLSIDCDCDGNPAEPDIHDIGILASTDPVALDQACLDLIYEAEGNESFVRRVEGQNGAHVLEAGEEIGLGSRAYRLQSVD